MTQTLRAVFFDFDYTLADTGGAIVKGFEHACAQMGLPYRSAEAVMRGIGGTLEQIYEGAVGPVPDEKTFERFRTLYREAFEPIVCEDTHFFPQTERALAKLCAMGLTLCVVTNKHARFAQEPLVRAGLSRYICRVMGREQMPAPKPDARGALSLATQLGFDKTQVLFCGDSLFDAQTAQNAGMPFAAVLTGKTPREAFDRCDALFVARDLDELAVFLEKCTQKS